MAVPTVANGNLSLTEDQTGGATPPIVYPCVVEEIPVAALLDCVKVPRLALMVLSEANGNFLISFTGGLPPLEINPATVPWKPCVLLSAIEDVPVNNNPSVNPENNK